MRAAGQNSPKDCPAAADVTVPQLFGLWRAEFDAVPAQGATVLLEANPRWEGSLSGAVNRDGVRSEMAGDLEGGELTLEESADGVRIAATWLGEVVDGSCGREIRGTRRAEDGSPDRGFVLRRLAPR